MKVSFFCTNRYSSREALDHPEWPVPRALYEPEAGLRSLEESLEQVRLAEELGFDWISCSEHHYTPLRQTPNAVLFAAALSQVVRRPKIAVLGPLVSMNNPVRIAEEIAMLDQLTGGRLIVMFLRGTPNEFLSYGVNPDETRARTQEASLLIIRALTEAQPFGWEPAPASADLLLRQQLRVSDLRGGPPHGSRSFVLPTPSGRAGDGALPE